MFQTGYTKIDLPLFLFFWYLESADLTKGSHKLSMYHADYNSANNNSALHKYLIWSSQKPNEVALFSQFYKWGTWVLKKLSLAQDQVARSGGAGISSNVLLA